jgi:hypothetical protein
VSTRKQLAEALSLVHGRLLPFRSQHSHRPPSFAPQPCRRSPSRAAT